MHQLTQLNEYVASLPDGLSSYPECALRAAFYRAFLEHVPLRDVARELPEPLRELVENPPPPRGWISEVCANALFLAAADLVLGDDARLDDAVYQMHKTMFARPIFKIMFMVISPKVMVPAASARWRSVHRGSTLTSKLLSDTSAVARVSFPEHAFPKRIADAYRHGFRAAYEVAFNKGVTLERVVWTPTSAQYHATWL